MELKESQQAVLAKYLVGSEQTWEDVCQRVSQHVAQVEPDYSHWKGQFYNLLANMDFVPGGSILANANHGTNGLQNCFVLGVEDNIESISQLVYDSILTTKFRGGIGIHIGSKGQPNYIRPKNSPFSDGQALGPCAVLDMVSECSQKLTTGNKARRGAFMFSMDWRHPDIWEFIQAKTESTIDANIARKAAEGNITETEFNEAWVETHLSPKGKRRRRWYNANISVHLDNEFFGYLELVDDPQWLKNCLPEELEKAQWARRLWDSIAELAHATADPGILFVDNAKSASPIRDFISTTNPCGEIWLPVNSSCNLGSINIVNFVNQHKDIDWDRLAVTVERAVRFLDNVLDVSNYATKAQRENITQRFRQIGLGIMGWADFLAKLGVAYDSDEHLELIDTVGKFIARNAYQASQQLAEEKGVCGVWGNIKDLPFNRDIDSGEPRRNSTVLAIAPTGSIAQLAGCSWAFEPHFGLVTWKQVYVDASALKQNWVPVLAPILDDLELSEADRETILATGSIQETEFAKANPRQAQALKIAREISPEWHVKVQAQWQKWIDSAISKTINLPSSATVEDIKAIYRLAADYRLKGVTVYRSGTLESEPVKVGSNEMAEEPTNGCRSGSCSL